MAAVVRVVRVEPVVVAEPVARAVRVARAAQVVAVDLVVVVEPEAREEPEARAASFIVGAKQPLSTSVLPDLDLFERIDAELREILADHRPEPLSESIRSEIASIQRSFAES